jgi:hypothetical protein
MLTCLSCSHCESHPIFNETLCDNPESDKYKYDIDVNDCCDYHSAKVQCGERWSSTQHSIDKGFLTDLDR